LKIVLNQYLPPDVFQTWKELIKKIANWDPSSRAWILSPQKIFRLPLWEVLHVYQSLKRFDISVILPNGTTGGSDTLWNALFPVWERGSWDRLPQNIEWKPPFFTLVLDEEKIRKVLQSMNDIYLPPEKRLASPSGLCTTAVFFDQLEIEKLKFNCNYVASTIPTGAKVYVLKGKIADVMKITEVASPYDLVWRFSWSDEIPDPQAYIKLPLRTYQRDAVIKTIETIGLRGGAVIRAPTGSGKTIMAVALYKELRALGLVKRAVLLAHTKDLVMQAANFFSELSEDEYSVGTIISEGVEVGDVTAMNVQMASKAIISSVFEGKTKNEKLEKALEVLRQADLVIVDEAHHVPSMTFRIVLIHIIGKPIVGLSATPWREDGTEPYLYGFIGPRSFSISLNELKEMGYLTGAKIYMVRPVWKVTPKVYLELLDASESRHDEKVFYLKRWNIISSWLASKHPERRKLIIDIVKRLPKPTLVLVDRVKEAVNLAEEMERAGLKAKPITGNLSAPIRRALISMLKRGEIDVLVATKLADEGLDIPQLRSLVIATLGKSSTKFPQRIGRALRKDRNKNIALIVDIADRVVMPAGNLYSTLESHFKKRLNIYRSEVGDSAVEVLDVEGLFKEL